MRAVFINPCHPDTSHVCALRARTFAEVLTAMGHRIILLTPPVEETGKGSDSTVLAGQLAAHDWTKPYPVTGPYRQNSILPSLRTGRCPAGLRQALIALNYLRHGGVYEDWCDGTRPLLPIVADAFRPEVVWAVCGHTGCWQMGQELAKRAGCPWVADLKDSWTNFIPPVLRGYLARRYDDAAHMTLLSKSHVATIDRWQPNLARTIVYSGIPRAFLTNRETLPRPQDGKRMILLTGGTYGLTAEIRTLLETLANWLRKESANPRPETVFAYAGADSDAVAAETGALDGLCTVRMMGFVPLETLHTLQKDAALNLYLHRSPFHHKVFELFTAGRPILCYPRENAETIHLAAQVGAQFHSCDTQDDLMAAFARTLGPDAPVDIRVDETALAIFSWEEQAKTLESVLKSAIENSLSR